MNNSTDKQMFPISHTEKGARFVQTCRDVLQRTTGRQFDAEVLIPVAGKKPHRFDLATREHDIVVECKAFTWTEGGNIPSAKISTLKEAVSYLGTLPGQTRRYLIIQRSPHPKRGETLAEYFARLNADLIGSVSVFELPEEGGELVCIRDPSIEAVTIAPPVSTAPPRPSPPADVVSKSLTSDDLNAMRSQLIRILDWIEQKPGPRSEGLAQRLSRLHNAGHFPRVMFALMHTVRELRNVAEYSNHRLTEDESSCGRAAWDAIQKWVSGKGWKDRAGQAGA